MNHVPPPSLLELVSPRVGVIRELQRISKGRREPELPIVYRSVLAHFDYRNADQGDRLAAGKGTTAAQAIASAIGEALERYCAAHVNRQELVMARVSDLPGPAIEPADLVLYAEDQYAYLPYARPDPDQAITWAGGRRLMSGETVYIPASLVYLGFGGAGMKEAFAMSTSSGLAAGPDLAYAIRSGIRELVERDAFLLTWMNRLPAKEIRLDGLDGAAGQVIRHYARHGVDVRVFHLQNDLQVHTCMAIGLDHERSVPAAAVGLSANLDPARAVSDAIMEMAQVRPGIEHQCRERTPGKKKYEDVRSLEDHSTFFAMPEHLDELDFLLNGEGHVAISDLTDYSTGNADADVEVCARTLADAGVDVAYVDLTTADLQEFPVRVVRVVATKLQPMHFGYGAERLGGERLFTIARDLGFDDVRRTVVDLNRCPHPLA